MSSSEATPIPIPIPGTDALIRGSVRVRHLIEADLERLCAWWNDPETARSQRGTALPLSAERTTSMFREWDAGSDSSLGLCITTAEGELVGHVALWGYGGVPRIGTMGLMIGPEYRNRGYGTDAVELLLRLAFEELDLHRVELGYYDFNSRGARVYERAGFLVEGRRREVSLHEGRLHDEIRCGILRAEWRARVAAHR
ncbi:GNAT family N-acetyltransferase [Mycetocola spongiae]|uniref:GNAT family N-acetyltransferase n=1 Tax=Mycetocola spongiae TaxID=2859226 RepID=UPI001CF35511|nr:GNAT family protein [Mycetocola spongiae]UCR88448.1 GNAT family N-acetyltransferase [Mycetocola spongiae]